MEGKSNKAQRKSALLEPGTIIGERFRVERALGEGGMGEVALATHVSLGVEVALKVAHGEQHGTPRLREEALALHRARHPGVVSLFDYAELPGQMAYLAMEYVHGGSLATLLGRGGPLDAQRTMRILRPLATVLDHVHSVGLVHRDLKPANVLVDECGEVKLCDFGLATDTAKAKEGRVGWLEGTPEHMAPEQALGGPVTPATDRWALAALAFELLTGARPYAPQPNAAKLLLSILERPPRRARELGLAGDHVNRFFSRALGRNVEGRPSTSVALVQELEIALRTSHRIEPAPEETAGNLPTQRVKPARLRVA